MTILLNRNNKKTTLKAVPLVAIRDGVVFPHTEAVLTFGRPKSTAAVKSAFRSDRLICFVTQKDPKISDPFKQDLYSVGTLASLERVLETNGEVHAMVKGIKRVHIHEIQNREPFLVAQVIEIPEQAEETDEIKALSKHLTNRFKKAVNNGKSIDFLIFMRLMSGVSPQELADQIAYVLDVSTDRKQELLEIIDVKKRLEAVTKQLNHEVKILEIEKSIDSKTKEKFDKTMREAVLRERKKTIEQELTKLGKEEEEEDPEIKEFAKKINQAKMPPKVKERAKKELKRLQKMSPHNPERSYISTYLEWLTDLPWSVSTPNNTPLPQAAKILDEDHHGLQKIKERIVEYLAVMKLKQKQAKIGKKKKNIAYQKNIKGPTILCFVGAPGVGKTSIGKSIARSLGRKFIRISLGGIRDEAEIRGHRRTYVGALPGRIIQGIKNADTNNPVFMLDEIDKVGTDFRGDPSAALLEALDPEQNSEFSDHYLEVPFDLSKVMFITTCNILDTIPPALRDRLEIIRFAGYTEEEKYYIAKKFLWKKQLLAHGLLGNGVKLQLSDKALYEIIRRYTREAGVRELERNLAQICRKIATKIASGNRYSQKLKKKDLHGFLGPAKFTSLLAEKKDEIGMATGLAWTQSGGEVLFIEVALMPGKGHLTLTGQLGDIMKESCKAALSYARTRWQELNLPKNFYQSTDVHVHVPEGAVPKDGPSAGCAIATAIVSAFTKKKTRKDVGMTGEITLRGRVLEIGGVKEKIIAAHRAGLKIIILPKDNKKDMEEVPKKVQKDIKFYFVSHMDEVLNLALR